jgi:DNA-binding CsgD family transcriptional regulator
MRNARPEPLSERQAEVAEMVARGHSNREIAMNLNVSPRTIDAHLASIFNKFGVRSRFELMATLLHRAVESQPVSSSAETQSSLGPGLVSRDEHKHNLPLELSSFIGRDSELSKLAAILEKRRLVTLTGAGGVGKTRLALRAGAALLGRLRDGVWLVDLSPVTDRSRLAEAISIALGVAPP